MKPYTRSIIELFDGKKRFLIPLYQRQYAWKSQPQLELLWEDIERSVQRLMEDRSTLTPHFMGAIVIAQVKTFGKQVQAYEIIDGQQRLTTFQLLLAAIRDVAKANGSKYEFELQKYLLNDGVMENPDVERFKLWPSLNDRRSLISIVDPEIDADTLGPRPDDEDGVVRRSVSAHAYFMQKIQAHVDNDGAFDEHRLEILFEALKEGLAIVSIELEGGDDPQTIFETLNSRGVDLTPGDLMRNFVFQRAKGMGQADHSLLVDKLYEKHWLPLDRAFWGQPASRGRQSRQRLDWMLTDHLSMHVGNLISVESLFESYRRWILNSRPYLNVTEELESISATAAIERRLFDRVAGDVIGNFGRFAETMTVTFSYFGLTIAGSGRTIDQRGWNRLSVIVGTGRVVGHTTSGIEEVTPKEHGIGSKNFGLRSLFLFGDRIHVRSNGAMAVMDLLTLGTTRVPDPTSAGTIGVSIYVPFRSANSGKLEVFSQEREAAAINGMAAELFNTLGKLSMAGKVRGIRRLDLSSERTGMNLQWVQTAETRPCALKGVDATRRVGRLERWSGLTPDRKETSSFEEVEYCRFVGRVAGMPVPLFPLYYEGPRKTIRVAVSLPIKRKRIQAQQTGFFHYPLKAPGALTFKPLLILWLFLLRYGTHALCRFLVGSIVCCMTHA